MLEAYNDISNPTKHVAVFYAQMTLYSTSDAIMCRAFTTTLRRIARGWYNRLPPSSIHSFNQLTREFERNFLPSGRPKPTTASLLGMRQKEEHLGQYLIRFIDEVKAILDRPPATVPEMLWRANHYVIAETLVVQKREDQKRPRVGGPAAGGVSSSVRKAYAYAKVQKRPRPRGNPGFTFVFESEYPDHDDALVVTACIGNACVRCIMINIGSSLDILYLNAFHKLGMTNRDLAPMTSTLKGFTSDVITIGKP
ncbi:hypothetical protein B296_00054744 [Ensete ventricosum]|uniref:Retrotransposon gag domain-containing protein n=1 Tax=Ensete ventricosum TaxID=4639 RepID=A0A426WYT3_ENSVE|nr:hypothetical protein B296_00054744 [Ensete ventricosum]